MIESKITQAVDILAEKEIDLWLTFVRETASTPDPILDLILGTNVVWPAALLISRTGKNTAIVGSLDAQNIRDHAPYDVAGYVDSIRQPLLENMKRLDPQRIAINTSKSDVMADGLTHGMYLTLLDLLKETPYAERLVSSEEIVAALRGRKSIEEIKRIKKAVDLTLEIFERLDHFLHPGLSEIEVARFVRDLMEKMDLEPAWDPAQCPAVFTGPESAGAHAGPTGRIIEPGHLMNIDFGVRWRGYVSDLQRTWYFLRQDETEAPNQVRNGFETLRAAIDLAAGSLRPGVQGWEVDQAARSRIVSDGYAEYPHALGHQVGRAAHDGAALLCPKWERYGQLPYLKVEAGQVYTIEPRLSVSGHGVVTVEAVSYTHLRAHET